MRPIVVLLLASGCGRIHFDPLDDASRADTPDLGVGPALCQLPFGQWTLSPPVALDDINSMLIAQFPANGDQDEYDPVFSENGLSLYFSSDQAGPWLVWVATRPSLTAPFGSVTLLGADVNPGPNGIFGFQPLASVGRAIVSAPYTGTLGSTDFWLGTNAGGPWAWAPTSLSTTGGDNDARLTANGLSVFFPRSELGGPPDIYRADRTSVDADFGAPVIVSELNSAMSESSPVPTADGIFVVTNRATGADDDLWYAEATGSGGFQPPYPLDALNTAAFEGEPAMFGGNGDCELIFSSMRSGTVNLYRTRVTAL